MDEGRLVRGRLWAETAGWWDEEAGTMVTKGRDFAAWFARLSNWIKRRSVRNAVGDYLLPGAARFAQEGGQLVQVVNADGTVVPG